MSLRYIVAFSSFTIIFILLVIFGAYMQIEFERATDLCEEKGYELYRINSVFFIYD